MKIYIFLGQLLFGVIYSWVFKAGGGGGGQRTISQQAVQEKQAYHLLAYFCHRTNDQFCGAHAQILILLLELFEGNR